MKASVIILSILLVLVLAVGAYLYYFHLRLLKGELIQAQETNKELEDQKARLETRVSELSAELEKKISEISQAKEEEVKKLKATYDELISNMQEEIKKGEIQITQLADQLKVNIVDRILFPSGEADITPAGVKVLERVGKILNQAQDKVIRVEGHTDNVPIAPKLQKKFPTNWELSTARATNVVRFLQEKVNIDPKRLEAVGYSEYRPIATNETPKGRAQNRRIEIALLPKK